MAVASLSEKSNALVRNITRIAARKQELMLNRNHENRCSHLQCNLRIPLYLSVEWNRYYIFYMLLHVVVFCLFITFIILVITE